MWSSVMRSACVTRSAGLRFVVTPLLARDSPSISCSRVPTCEAASMATERNSDDGLIKRPLPRNEAGVTLPGGLARTDVVAQAEIACPSVHAAHQRYCL